MIRTTRRQSLGAALMGALAVPTVAGLASWRWQHGEDSILLHDPALAAGRRFADAGAVRGAKVRAIEGDRIRFMREVLAGKPALIAGVTRYADTLLIEDAAREAGYARVALLHGRAGACSSADCRPGWHALGRMASAAGGEWVEALADFARKPGEGAGRVLAKAGGATADAGLVLGWVLAPRG